MSVLVSSLLVAGGVMIGRIVARAVTRARAERDGGAQSSADVSTQARAEPGRRGVSTDASSPAAKGSAPRASAEDLLTEFPCRLGDVVLRSGGEEAWLAGALVFFERLAAAALFIAPDAGGDRALYVRPKPNASLTWLMPIPAGELVLGPEPPSSLEHKSERFERVRRIPFRVERVGTGAPDVGDQAIVAEYGSPSGERLLIIAGQGASRAWRGHVLEDGMYDVLPSGKSTL